MQQQDRAQQSCRQPNACLPACLPTRLPQVAVMAVLPTTWADPDLLADANERYAELAKRQGAAFLDCGGGLDPWDSTQYEDGLHLTAAGLDVMLACMRAGLQPLLG